LSLEEPFEAGLGAGAPGLDLQSGLGLWPGWDLRSGLGPEGQDRGLGGNSGPNPQSSILGASPNPGPSILGSSPNPAQRAPAWREAPDLYRRAVQIHVLADAKRQQTRNREDLVTAYDAAEIALMESRHYRDPEEVLRIGDFVRRFGA